jgi:hypothetical protein
LKHLAQGTGTNIFGQSSANTGTANPLGGSNLFGQPSGGGGTNLFGQPAQNQNQNQPQPSLFGSQAQPQQQQQQQQQQPPLFSSTARAPFTTSQLNPNASQARPGMFGAGGRLGASFAPIQEPSLQQRIEDIYKAWDTNSAEGACKFQVCLSSLAFGFLLLTVLVDL